jgi:hypothetical protein
MQVVNILFVLFEAKRFLVAADHLLKWSVS